MRIGVDIDGVLRDLCDSLLVQYHKDFPNHEVEAITRWDLHHFFPVGKMIYPYAFDVKAKEVFEDAEPYPGAYAAMVALKERGHEIIYVTTQPRGKEIHTLNWLLKHCFPYDGLVFTGIKDITNCDVYIDDGPHNIKALRDAGRLAFCFDQPWNRAVAGERVKSLQEFVEVVDGLNTQRSARTGTQG